MRGHDALQRRCARGRFFIARNVPLSEGTNSVEADTDADTLADHSPSSDTVTDVALDTSLNVSYTYNANGDLVLKSEEGGAVQWSYSYSVDGWLTTATKIVDSETVLTEEYSYDPIGRKYRVKTTDGTGSTERYFAYDGGSIVLELEEDSGDYLLEKEHVRGLSLGGGIGGLLYTRDADGTTGYFHYDGRGNVVSITNDAREEIAYYEYDAWGNVLTACGDLSNEHRFSAEHASLGTGLIDFGYRWYDSSVGRWTQREPLGLLGGVNAYAYVYGNPTNLADAGGLVPFDPNDTYGGTPIRPGASQDCDGSYNPLSGKVREWSAASEGFQEGFGEGLDDLGLTLQGVGGASEIILGAVLLCSGNPWGVFLILDGADSLTEAIVEGAYGTDYRSFTELAGDLMEKLGLPRELGEGGYSLLRLWCTLRAGKSLKNSCGSRPRWPDSPDEMDDFLGIPGERVPDGSEFPGRGKVKWRPSDNIQIRYEAHRYDVDYGLTHRNPHYHIDTKIKGKKGWQKVGTYKPGDEIPGNW
jgi:RHS repeat-associated protein